MTSPGLRIVSVDDALLDRKRRFKNLPERHFKSVEALVRRQLNRNTEVQSVLGNGSVKSLTALHQIAQRKIIPHPR